MDYKFKVGDIITPKTDYTNENWSNAQMVSAGVGIKFGGAYTVVDVKKDKMMLKGISQCDFSMDRFVLLKSKIVQDIIKDL